MTVRMLVAIALFVLAHSPAFAGPFPGLSGCEKTCGVQYYRCADKCSPGTAPGGVCENRCREEGLGCRSGCAEQYADCYRGCRIHTPYGDYPDPRCAYRCRQSASACNSSCTSSTAYCEHQCQINTPECNVFCGSEYNKCRDQCERARPFCFTHAQCGLGQVCLNNRCYSQDEAM